MVRILGIAALVLTAVPVAFVLWFAWGADPNPPIADQWELVSFFGRVRAGEATLVDWMFPHNGLHVIVVGRAVLLGLAYLTDWNLRAEQGLCLALVLGTFAMLVRLGREALGGDTLSSRVTALFTMALLLAPEQHRIWVWTIGFFHYLENALAVGATLALTRRKPRVALAALLCTIATFNRIEAIALWVVLLPLLLRAVAPETRRRTVTLWALLAGISSAAALVPVILFGFAQPGLSGASTGLFGVRAAFSLSLMGSAPASFSEASAANVAPTFAFVPAGGVVFAVFVALAASALRSRDERATALPFLTIGVFGILFCGAAALGRALLLDVPVLPAIVRVFLDWCVSAYSATASFVAIATLHLLSIRLAKMESRKNAVRLGAFAVALGLLVSTANYAHALPLLRERRATGDAGKYCVELASYWEPENACLLPRNAGDLLQKARLRLPRTPVTMNDAATGARVAHVTVTILPETRWEVERVRVTGDVDGTGLDPGAVLLGFPGSEKFFAQASASRRNGRVSFELTLPNYLLRGHDREARAFWYRPDLRRIEPLAGELKL